MTAEICSSICNEKAATTACRATATITDTTCGTQFACSNCLTDSSTFLPSQFCYTDAGAKSTCREAYPCNSDRCNRNPDSESEKCFDEDVNHIRASCNRFKHRCHSFDICNNDDRWNTTCYDFNNRNTLSNCEAANDSCNVVCSDLNRYIYRSSSKCYDISSLMTCGNYANALPPCYTSCSIETPNKKCYDSEDFSGIVSTCKISYSCGYVCNTGNPENSAFCYLDSKNSTCSDYRSWLSGRTWNMTENTDIVEKGFIGQKYKKQAEYSKDEIIDSCKEWCLNSKLSCVGFTYYEKNDSGYCVFKGYRDLDGMVNSENPTFSPEFDYYYIQK